jgi:hypothetical protein
MQFTTAAIAAIPTAIMKGVAPKATITIAASAMAIAAISAQELRGAPVVSTLLNFNYICESHLKTKNLTVSFRLHSDSWWWCVSLQLT